MYLNKPAHEGLFSEEYPPLEALADIEILDDKLNKLNELRNTTLNVHSEINAFKVLSVATVLYKVYDICPYCEGKYVG